ncbi:MAG TPA: hypothetical protein VLD59_01420 [Steroidobacteraceae bacterium]|nr:hypothetical protein [Steroidobacteraceae bacterium]
MSEFVHPETGEVLATEQEWRAALEVLEERLTPIYRELRPLRAAYAERFPGPELPRRRYRTETQERVARCPRCGQTYADAQTD